MTTGPHSLNATYLRDPNEPRQFVAINYTDQPLSPQEQLTLTDILGRFDPPEMFEARTKLQNRRPTSARAERKVRQIFNRAVRLLIGRPQDQLLVLIMPDQLIDGDGFPPLDLNWWPFIAARQVFYVRRGTLRRIAVS